MSFKGIEGLECSFLLEVVDSMVAFWFLILLPGLTKSSSFNREKAQSVQLQYQIHTIFNWKMTVGLPFSMRQILETVIHSGLATFLRTFINERLFSKNVHDCLRSLIYQIKVTQTVVHVSLNFCVVNDRPFHNVPLQIYQCFSHISCSIPYHKRIQI